MGHYDKLFDQNFWVFFLYFTFSVVSELPNMFGLYIAHWYSLRPKKA